METLRALLQKDMLDPATFVGAVVYAVVFFLLAWLLVRFLNVMIRRRRERLKESASGGEISFLYQLGRIGIYVFAVVLYAHLIPALQSMGTALLAGVSVASIVIGLAAQSTLSNLIAGIVLIITLTLKVWCENAADVAAAQSDVLQQVHQRFSDRFGISQ